MLRRQTLSPIRRRVRFPDTFTRHSHGRIQEHSDHTGPQLKTNCPQSRIEVSQRLVSERQLQHKNGRWSLVTIQAYTMLLIGHLRTFEPSTSRDCVGIFCVMELKSQCCLPFFGLRLCVATYRLCDTNSNTPMFN